MIGALIELMRPRQWVKNVFVLLPLFFGGRMLDGRAWIVALLAFAAFSLMASSVYCLNDLRDIEADRKHPEKQSRPLASAKVRPLDALILMVVLIVGSLSISFFTLGPAVIGLLLLYLVLNVAYSFKLKQFAIIDVFIVAFGFVLRLLAGGFACDIWLSPWIVLMTFLLALFLAFAKRRDDVVLLENEQIITRRNVMRYNLPFMNQTLGMIGAITVVCYIMYSVSPEVVARFGNDYLYVTSIFVLAGILRYLQLVIVDNCSGSPTKIILRDRFIQVCLLLWFATFAILLYL